MFVILKYIIKIISSLNVCFCMKSRRCKWKIWTLACLVEEKRLNVLVKKQNLENDKLNTTKLKQDYKY